MGEFLARLEVKSTESAHLSRAADAIVALMIGELPHQYPLNKITRAIVVRAANLWRDGYARILVCESPSMVLFATLREPQEEIVPKTATPYMLTQRNAEAEILHA